MQLFCPDAKEAMNMEMTVFGSPARLLSPTFPHNDGGASFKGCRGLVGSFSLKAVVDTNGFPSCPDKTAYSVGWGKGKGEFSFMNSGNMIQFSQFSWVTRPVGSSGGHGGHSQRSFSSLFCHCEQF